MSAAVRTGLLVVLVINSITDIRKREICLRLTIGIGAVGLLRQLLLLIGQSGGATEGWSRLFSFLPGSILLLSSMAGGGVGIGDGIALLMLGCWLSFENTALITAGSLVLLLPASMTLFLTGKRRKTLPYLPFLTAAYLLIWMGGRIA